MTQTRKDKIIRDEHDPARILSDEKTELTPDEFRHIKDELSKDEVILTQDEITEATDILTFRNDFDTLNQRLTRYGINPLSGRGLFSYLLPIDFNYDGSKIEKEFEVIEYQDDDPTEIQLKQKNVRYENLEEKRNQAKAEKSPKNKPGRLSSKKSSSESEKKPPKGSFSPAERAQSPMTKAPKFSREETIYKWKKITSQKLEWGVKIRDGVLIRGTITKAHVGNTHNSIVHHLWLKYGKVRTAAFLTDGTFLTDWFIFNYGFSIGYTDCVAPDPDAVQKTVDDEMHNAELSIDSLGPEKPNMTKLEKEYREQQMRDFTDNAATIGKRIASEQLPYTNALNIMSESGAKGNASNTAQICGLVGQQFVRRQRPIPTLDKSRRCMPYFAPNSRKLEARGMIRQSFMQGISPAGLFFHMMASRIGLVSTSISTADTGALHRRVSKALESTCVAYDGSVRNLAGAVFQLACFDGFEAGQMIPTNHPGMGSAYSFIDIRDTIMNLNHCLQNRMLELGYNPLS